MKYAIGVDIGGTNLKVGLVDENGNVIDSFAMPIDNAKPFEVTVNCLGKEINKFLKNLNINKKDCEGVGIGCPGVINSETGFVDFSCNLHWDKAPLKQKMEEITGLETKITNDANAAALGEAKYGSGKSFKNTIMLTLGTGVGGGIVLDGKLYEGNEGKGAELGHIIIKENGRKCTCGLRGCLETYASATGLTKTTKIYMKKYKDSKMWDLVKGNIDNVDSKVAFDADLLGDKAATIVVNEYVRQLGNGILSFCNIFRPNAIVLSGGVAKQGTNLTDRLTKYCAERYYGYKNSPEVVILPAKLGYNSGIIGAAALFF